MGLKGCTVWITGASAGIGKALAVEISKYDANLILSSRNLRKLEEVKSLCQDSERVEILELDLVEQEAFDSKVKTALAFFNRIDILINNAGISQRSLAIDTKAAVGEKIFDVNYFGTVALTQAILPHFIKNRRGQVAVVSSVVGKIGTPLRSSYSASKHALHGYFDSLRAELYPTGVKITIICPGFVNTDVSIHALTGDGSEQGSKDKATANGLSPEKFAKKAVRAIHRQKQEVVIGGFLEHLGVWVKRFFPRLLARMVRKVPVT